MSDKCHVMLDDSWYPAILFFGFMGILLFWGYFGSMFNWFSGENVNLGVLITFGSAIIIPILTIIIIRKQQMERSE